MVISLNGNFERDSRLPPITIGYSPSTGCGLRTFLRKVHFIFEYFFYYVCIKQKERAIQPVISPLVPSKNLVSYQTFKKCLDALSPKKMEPVEEKTSCNRLYHSPYLYPSQQCLGMATRFLTSFKNSTQSSFKEKILEAGKELQEGATWESMRSQSLYEVKIGAQARCSLQNIRFYRQLIAQTHQTTVSSEVWQAKKVSFLQTKRTSQEKDLFEAIKKIFSQNVQHLHLKDQILKEMGQKYQQLDPSIYGLILEVEAEFQFLQHSDQPRYDQLNKEATEAACQLKQLHVQSHQTLSESAAILQALTQLPTGSYLIQFPRHTIAYVRDSSQEMALFDANNGTFYPTQEQENLLLKDLIAKYTSGSTLGTKILLISGEEPGFTEKLP